MTYKLIACDLDETLLDSNHNICTENITAITKAAQLGVKFVPATGRGFIGIQSILDQLDLIQKDNQYVISFNGAAITENKNNKIISFDGVPFSKINELFQFGLKKDVAMHIYTAETFYVYNLNDDEKTRLDHQKTPYVVLTEPSIEILKDTPIAKILYQNLDTDYMRSFEKEMAPIVEGHCDITYSSNRYMEFNATGVNKGRAMLNLAKRLNIKPEETIAVGDNYNDMAMLQMAGLSVAAGNSVDGIKEIADYVCENDNNQGVVAELIHKYIL